MEIPALDEEEMQMIYNWVDEIPLSRPKRNIARDFSDGVLVAEVVKHFIPHLVEIHNYSAAHSVSQKTYNWNTLNQKVFKKLGFTLSKKDVEDSVNCVPDTVERILKVLQASIKSYQEKKQNKMGSGGNAIQDNDLGFNSHNPLGAQGYSGGMGGLNNPIINKENNKFMSGGFNQQNNFSYPQQNYPMSAGGVGMGGLGGVDPRQKAMLQSQVDNEILMEKESTIQQMKETIEILELKIKKLEQLVKLKDAKISNLSNKLQTAGIIP